VSELERTNTSALRADFLRAVRGEASDPYAQSPPPHRYSVGQVDYSAHAALKGDDGCLYRRCRAKPSSRATDLTAFR
jgi:hypothetical protein